MTDERKDPTPNSVEHNHNLAIHNLAIDRDLWRVSAHDNMRRADIAEQKHQAAELKLGTVQMECSNLRTERTERNGLASRLAAEIRNHAAWKHQALTHAAALDKARESAGYEAHEMLREELRNTRQQITQLTSALEECERRNAHLARQFEAMDKIAGAVTKERDEALRQCQELANEVVDNCKRARLGEKGKEPTVMAPLYGDADALNRLLSRVATLETQVMSLEAQCTNAANAINRLHHRGPVG